jgi:hypothetical protein
MSAAATAAGYLYASGRLRGRAAKDQEQADEQPQQKDQPVKVHVERAPRVAVYPQEDKPRRTPKIEYRKRRWSPE